jgi:hypothetical protein
MKMGQLRPLDLLAYQKFPVYPFAWFYTSEMKMQQNALHQLLISMMDWRLSSATAEVAAQHANSLDDTIRSLLPMPMFSIGSLWDSSFANLYHTPTLTTDAAECLWQAGFRDLNASSGYFKDPRVTPLWIQISQALNVHPDWMPE